MNFRDTLKINKEGHLEIGGVDTVVLAEDYGTPLYVMDEKHIEDMCDIFINTIKTKYGEGTCAYASKAFSCKDIYRIIDKHNLALDVVSAGELYTAVSVKFPMEKVFFHGSNKTTEELEMALKNKVGYIVCDAITEIEKLDRICGKLKTKQNVLLRINPGIEAHTHHYIQTAKLDSKFGFAIQDGYAFNAVKTVVNCKNLQLAGLHCHIGSQIFEFEPFGLAVNKMTDFIKEINDVLNAEIDILNMGGGFGIWYTEGDDKKTVADYAKYVETIIDALNIDIKSKKIKKPILVVEPGRSLIGEAGITLYRVGNIKDIKGVKKYVSIDGGMFENPRYALYQAKYTAVCANKMNDKHDQIVTLTGKCCESADMIAEGVMLPNVKDNDVIAVFSTGAYNYAMASNYNRNPVPPVVKVKNGDAEYMVKPQSLQDLIRNDI